MSATATRRSQQRSAPSPAHFQGNPPEAWLPFAERLTEQAKGAGNYGELLHQAACGAIDFALVCAGGTVAFWLRFGAADPFSITSPSEAGLWQFARSARYPGFLFLYAALVVLACMSRNLYSNTRTRTSWEETNSSMKAAGFATGLLVLFIFLSGNREISLIVVACAGTWNVGALAGWRYAKRRYDLHRVQRGEGVSRVLIVGAGKVGRTLAAWLEANRQLGYHVCGFLDPHPNSDPRVLGSVGDLRKIAIGQFADELFVTLPADRELVKELFLEARNLRLNLTVVPDLYDGLAWCAPVATIGGFPVIELHGEPIPVLGLAVKRALDALGAATLLLLTSPLLAAAALWIQCDSRGSTFYSALRVGKKGRRFRCYKLRTMIAEADAQKDQLRHTNNRSGPFFKMDNDPRVTRCGRWLRKYSIDELPQLVNVLLGDMSLVGPRPHPIDDFERYSIEHLRRLDVKPGVTGLWQVTARRDPSFDTNMVLDLEYIESWSLRLDLRILLRTLKVVFEGEGQ